MADYLDNQIIKEDPFQTIDREGVGYLITTAVENGRKSRSDIKIGICGEHGGDPDSVEFCHESGLDYVSCSPYRVGIARLAAAQSALTEAEAEKAKSKPKPKPKKVQSSIKRAVKSKPAKKAVTPAPTKKRPVAKRVVRRPKRTKR